MPGRELCSPSSNNTLSLYISHYTTEILPRLHVQERDRGLSLLRPQLMGHAGVETPLFASLAGTSSTRRLEPRAADVATAHAGGSTVGLTLFFFLSFTQHTTSATRKRMPPTLAPTATPMTTGVLGMPVCAGAGRE